MVKAAAKLIFLLSLLLSLPGCNKIKPLGSGPIKVQIPWAERGQDYSLQTVEIHTLKDPVRMEGDAARVRVNQQTDQRPPEARFVQVEEGVLVPLDVISNQLFTVYAHMERLLFLESELGISQLIPRPRFVSIDSRVIEEETHQRVMDNATFVGPSDFLALMPISTNSLPITMNGGVIAHEQFHAIFYHLMLKTLSPSDLEKMDRLRDDWGPQEKDLSLKLKNIRSQLENNASETKNNISESVQENRVYNNQFILLALNEGFADFWGWLYSGDNNFIVRSVPEVGTQRAIPSQAMALPSDQEFQKLLSGASAVDYRGAAYFLGTHYASLLRKMAEQNGRMEVAQRVLESFKNIQTIWLSLDHSKKLSPKIIYDIICKSSQESCT